MSNFALYTTTLLTLLVVNIALLSAATTAELWHSMMISEVQLLAAAVTIVCLLRRK